jgi:hypothetical protein
MSTYAQWAMGIIFGFSMLCALGAALWHWPVELIVGGCVVLLVLTVIVSLIGAKYRWIR